ncbi:MAG: HAD family phosphatase [Deltaproteobacteria bacterium]|nr:HAD family phosphatase [Deltaproteobacteria bacterium]
MKKYKALLFDFDGVLGKTMEGNYLAWVYAFDQFGMTIKREDYFSLEGKSPTNVAKTLLAVFGKPENLADELSRLKENHYLSHHSFELYPGVESLIHELKKTYPLALVTGASRKRLDGSVPTDFLGQFDAIITGETGQEDKPSPEPYLRASAKLGIEPDSCLVIENAPLGIESAKRAGMDCVAICSTLKKEFLGRADKVINTIEDLPPLL